MKYKEELINVASKGSKMLTEAGTGYTGYMRSWGNRTEKLALVHKGSDSVHSFIIIYISAKFVIFVFQDLFSG